MFFEFILMQGLPDKRPCHIPSDTDNYLTSVSSGIHLDTEDTCFYNALSKGFVVFDGSKVNTVQGRLTSSLGVSISLIGIQV